MTTPRLFLETSIQLDRLLHTARRKRTIQKNLADRPLCTSSYVHMEFRRTIIQDICFVRSIVKSDCGRDADGYIFLSDLDRRLASGQGNYSARSARRCFLVTAAIKDQFPEASVSKSELIEYLDLLIDQLEREFYVVIFDLLPLNDSSTASVDYLDLTSCRLAQGYPICEHLGLTCSRSKADCRLVEFIENNLRKFVDISNAFMAAPPNQRDDKMVEAVGRLLSTSSRTIVLGQRNCWPLGDAIIALEAPEDCSIYSKDHHFEVICRAIGKPKHCEIQAGEG